MGKLEKYDKFLLKSYAPSQIIKRQRFLTSAFCFYPVFFQIYIEFPIPSCYNIYRKLIHIFTQARMPTSNIKGVTEYELSVKK
jgi:hypothetical protein